MNKPNLKELFIRSSKAIEKSAPKILLGLGIVGMGVTVVTAVASTPKALKLIEEEKEKKELNNDHTELTKVEVAKTVWKCYIPSLAIGSISTLCLLGSCSIQTKRTAAAIAAYKISETTYEKYKNAVIDSIGVNKEKKVIDKMSENQLKESPVNSKDSNIIVTGNGDMLVVDGLTGQIFKSDVNKIKAAINDINKRMLLENYVSMTEVYEMLGLDATDMSDMLGWHIDKDGYLEVNFSAQITEDSQPCLVMHFNKIPRFEFSSSYY